MMLEERTHTWVRITGSPGVSMAPSATVGRGWGTNPGAAMGTGRRRGGSTPGAGKTASGVEYTCSGERLAPGSDSSLLVKTKEIGRSAEGGDLAARYAGLP